MTNITDQKTDSTNVNSDVVNWWVTAEEAATLSQNDSQVINATTTNEWDITNGTSVSQNISQNESWETITPSAAIKVTIQWSDWIEIGSFAAKKGETIMALAQANNVEIPFSCGAGACWLCLCYIVRWWEYINKEYTTPSFMQLDEDQVLTCIAAVKDECFDGENANIEIILKRAY